MANQTVLITGSSTGIGLSSAIYFLERGWNVIATMRSPEKARGLKASEKLLVTHLDVTDISSIENAIKEGLARFSNIDVLVNNAGYGLVGPFECSTPEQIEKQFATNVFGLMNTTRTLLPYFRERKKGMLINVASMGGRLTFPLYSIYHATKWAVEGFSESLQFELEQFNIKVKIIEPGAIKTDFYSRSMDMMTKPGLTAYDNYVSKTWPKLHGFGDRANGPEVVAKVIYQAATDGSDKMRYQADSMGILLLRRILPEWCALRLVRDITSVPCK